MHEFEGRIKSGAAAVLEIQTCLCKRGGKDWYAVGQGLGPKEYLINIYESLITTSFTTTTRLDRTTSQEAIQFRWVASGLNRRRFTKV